MELLSLQNVTDLAVLIFLQAVLGFDNLLYLSIESKRAPENKQSSVRKTGIFIAIALRIVLLFVVVALVDGFKQPFFAVHLEGVLEVEVNFATTVFLLGGAFIMYTAVKEIHHMMALEAHVAAGDKSASSVGRVLFMIVLMNLVFSFDSILSAIAITRVMFVLATAIIISGVLMVVLADRVAEFLKKNREYEILGLFVLLIVGVVLIGEGGHESHMKVLGYAIEPMAKSTFYFSIVVLVIVDLLQSRYQRKLKNADARLQGATS